MSRTKLLQKSIATKKEALLQTILLNQGHDDYVLPERLTIPLPDRTITVIAMAVSPMRELWLASDYDTDFIYHPLEESDVNYDVVVNALYNCLLVEEGVVA